MSEIFLGQPPARIKKWIDEHYAPAPAGHADTWYKYAEDTEWRTVSITGSIDGNAGAIPTKQIPNVKNVVALEIGTDVTSIGYDAFYGCRGLTSITIGNGVTSISGGAFKNCNGLTNVMMSNSVTSIGQDAFAQCSSLMSMTIPDNVTSIREGAFQNCSRLMSVTIPNSVTSIAPYVFSGCSSLISVTIPDSVTSIGEWAFSGCNSLASVTFNSFTKNEVKSMTTNPLDYIFYEAFYDDKWNPIEKSFTAVCTDGSMTVHFSADEPAIITFTDL